MGYLIVLGVLLVLGAAIGLHYLRLARSGPRLGTNERAALLQTEAGGPCSTTVPDGVTPGELGAQVLPPAHYQQVTATFLDLADRGHLTFHLTDAADDGSALWTLTRRTGRDELRPYELLLLTETGLATGPEDFPALTNRTVTRVTRLIRRTAGTHRATGAAGRALQRGLATRPDHATERDFAFSVALDVSPAVARSLDQRGVPTPRWATATGKKTVSWAHLNDFGTQGGASRNDFGARPGDTSFGNYSGL